MAGQGEDRSFDDLFEAHYESVWRFVARRLPRSEVDDVVAEVFVTAWRRRHELREDSLRPWLYGVARRQVANSLRGQVRRSGLLGRLKSLRAVEVRTVYDELAAGVIDPEGHLGRIWALLAPHEREVLLLEAWEQLSMREIALVLNVSEATARQRLSRARRSAQRAHDAVTGGPDPLSSE